MFTPKVNAVANGRDWRAGQRVSRKDSEELGTVLEANGEIKVKWDGGRTSYFRRGKSGAPASDR